MKPFVFTLLCSLLLTACTEKPADPIKITPPPEPVREPSGDTPPPAPAAPAATSEPATSAHDMVRSVPFADMNKLVELFYESKKRIPNMAELARSYGRPLPIPPVGYIFVIDAQAKQVKLVPLK